MTETGEADAQPKERELPDEQHMFKNIMLTVETVWRNDLSRDDIEEWLRNFTGKIFDIEYERKLALWLLHNFVFYNEDDVKHLCRTLFSKYLHARLTAPFDHGQFVSSEDLSAVMSDTLFYHVGIPGESGAYILYYFRQVNKLGLAHFMSRLDSIPESAKNILFVDDVTISGEQATKYFDQSLMDSLGDDRTLTLLTFIATSEAKQLLAAKGVDVISCIDLDERSRLFEPCSDAFHQFEEHRSQCELFAEEYGKDLWGKYPLGYGGGQLAFGFFYNTPGNALPLFWSSKNGWSPIMRRYGKKYGGSFADDFPTFI